ncbi:MAG: SpoIIE family protein phosphatase [Melioribacteraceae bacterium]|nr:SpoIIE family protein phosphatase [Melioribacteraceae bacterium]MDD3558560.1 SpoIIE family protein phosphatase [Melioribacteraceae bacterium]
MKNFIDKIIISFFILTFLFSSVNYSQELIKLSADSISGRVYYPNSNQKFTNKDNIDFSLKDYNDTQWEILDTRFLPENSADWNGVGWFRFYFDIDSSLVNKNIALFIYNTGKIKMYLNGEFYLSTNKMDRIPKLLRFTKSGMNIIAVKFENPDWITLNDAGHWAGFRLVISEFEYGISLAVDQINKVIIERLIFVIPALILSLIHLLIFLFDRRTKQNLYYVGFLLFFAFYIYILFNSYLSTSQISLVFFGRLAPFTLNFLLLMGSLTIFAIFNHKSKNSKWYVLAAFILGISGFIMPGKIIIYYFSYAFISIVSAEAGRIMFRKDASSRGVSNIIRIGFLIFSFSGIYQMILSFDLVGPLFGTYNVFLYGVLVFLLSMSIALAKEFVENKLSLEKQLVQVRELSQKTLEQELEAKELENQKKILELENKRKTKELEEARELQLSMLPQKLPQFENLDIATYLTTAAEVGGDYYDFLQTDDGSLLIAVGDATGHGMKAGIMVSIVKGLLKSVSSINSIPDFFNRSTAVIKEMNLGNLFMSLSILKIKNGNVTASFAGMPPLYHYNSEKRKVEQIVLKGMPLGAYNNFPYETRSFSLKQDDVLLIISDGIVELFDDKKKMFDYERVAEVLNRNHDKSPKEIISSFEQEIKKWLNGKLQDDDITMLVVKSI